MLSTIMIQDCYCNSQSPPLVADIVLSDFSFRASPQGFKTRLLGRRFHTLIKNVSFPFPTNVGSHNPPLFEAQRPC